MIKERKISLQGQDHQLSHTDKQLEILEQLDQVNFTDRLRGLGKLPFKPIGIDIFQVNMGKMCNQVCKHCHVDAGPDRKEIMTQETMQQCLDALDQSDISTVDLTGGAPEMNPDFEWFVEELSSRGKHVIVRCNLTIILANKKYNNLPEFFKKHKVEVVSSLPHFSAKRTDAQRGDGVFEKSIEALKMLNAVGYGLPDSDLKLNLVYNPSGAFLPADQTGLESEFKRKLKVGFDIDFHELYAITNLPISRFLDYLVASENYEEYMQKLIDAFNPGAVDGVMCRNTISVGWDGHLYDCDFNQMLDLKLNHGAPNHIRDFDVTLLTDRKIILNNHCFGCTAGAGSSCGGVTT
ncbi:MAG: arsenosugar biosynthesis radical SAM (seleno)protein ArsS [Reichenbachiella sp.]|uniref:arsenosugar biosynthesis radical SAM (seleno)protein ArsS n=1 Tax=Reichenbachiella sp. TaxID=2184521 RepID=UPI003267E1DB